ncbi:MAG: hypothetical protein ACRCU3_03780 [Eubacteriaceae bacterium]
MEKKVVMVDKTVPDQSYTGHQGFVWIMNYLKILNSDTKKPFDYKNDYYGFYPEKNYKYKEKKLPEDLGKPDFIYLLDTYGVYTQDFYSRQLNRFRTDLIVGGLTDSEVTSVENALDKNILISEFNVLATPMDEVTREHLENLIGVTWKGWIGRYINDLDQNNSEMPGWMVENYVLKYGKRWEYKGPGIIFLNRENEMVVLSDKEIGNGFIKILFTNEAEKELNIKNNVNYHSWFDVSLPKEGTAVLGTYHLDLTDLGKKSLEENGIPIEFVAMTKKVEGYTSYYFGGDYSNAKSFPSLYFFKGQPWLNKITTIENDSNQLYFYWNVYYPMIKSILSGNVGE